MDLDAFSKAAAVAAAIVTPIVTSWFNRKKNRELHEDATRAAEARMETLMRVRSQGFVNGWHEREKLDK